MVFDEGDESLVVRCQCTDVVQDDFFCWVKKRHATQHLKKGRSLEQI